MKAGRLSHYPAPGSFEAGRVGVCQPRSRTHACVCVCVCVCVMR